MSKANRRRQRPGTNPSTARPASPPPPPASTVKPVTGASSDPAATPAFVASGATTTSAAAAASTSAGTPRPGTSRPTSTRAGRRERQRAVTPPTFLERYRTMIIVVAALAGVALLSAFVFLSASQPAYACSTIWTPTPTAPPAAGATPALGYVQPDMGRQHVSVGDKVTFTYCAPASGNHYNRPGSAGPIPARVYGPSDSVLPQGWIHNLEHGGIVILYTGSGPGATADGQAQLHALYDAFPSSPVCNIPKGENSPVIARFDQMSTPFQAIVWGRVLTMDALDQAKILAFYEQWGERTNPEKQCAPPSSSPSAAPGASAAPSTAPSVEPSISAAPSAAPSDAAAPSPS